VVEEKLGGSKEIANESPFSFERLFTEKAFVFGVSSPDDNKREHRGSRNKGKP
jgi:hypothetical protein